MTTGSDRLEVTLPSDLEIRMTRIFRAPRALVFEVFTQPQHVARWWGWRTSEPVVFEADVRPGGSWRYVARDAYEGETVEVGFHGQYIEVEPPSRVVYTEIFEGLEANDFPGDPGVNTVMFEDHEDGTLLTCTSKYPSKEVRDLVVQSGMETGAAVSYDRLEELALSLMASP